MFACWAESGYGVVFVDLAVLSEHAYQRNVTLMSANSKSCVVDVHKAGFYTEDLGRYSER